MKDEIKKVLEDISLEEIINLRLEVFLSHLNENGLKYEKSLHAKIIKMVEFPLIKNVLEKCGNNKSKAAQILGLNRNTLNKRIKDLKIPE